MKKRLNLLKKRLKQEKVETFLINNLTNIKYLSGFSGTLAFILITENRATFFTDARYFERVKKEIPAYFSLEEIENSFIDYLKSFLKKYKIRRIGFESTAISYYQLSLLKKKLPSITFVPLNNIIESVRVIKDQEEIKQVKRAIALNDQVFAYLKNRLSRKPFLNGDELALKGEVFIKERGAEGFAFDPIIAFSKDSAAPHALRSKRRLKDNDTILIDFGTEFHGYHSDLTRVYFKKGYKGRLREIYQIVLAAQQKAIAKIKPGVKASDIDKEARDYITQKGYDNYFKHSLGHGIGLEVHESPKISSQSSDILREGMVFSVEPGIYIPGVGGVRIEDLVLVTKKGCQVLSKAKK
ncbi:M24 family metallopeptidase [Candidatus Auribacterota bacterium]